MKATFNGVEIDITAGLEIIVKADAPTMIGPVRVVIDGAAVTVDGQSAAIAVEEINGGVLCLATQAMQAITGSASG